MPISALLVTFGYLHFIILCSTAHHNDQLNMNTTDNDYGPNNCNIWILLNQMYECYCTYNNSNNTSVTDIAYNTWNYSVFIIITRLMLVRPAEISVH